MVIVQDDRFDATASITVCPFTTDSTDAPLFRPVIEPSPANGLHAVSRLMADKVTTVSQGPSWMPGSAVSMSRRRSDWTVHCSSSSGWPVNWIAA